MHTCAFSTVLCCCCKWLLQNNEHTEATLELLDRIGYSKCKARRLNNNKETITYK